MAEETRITITGNMTRDVEMRRLDNDSKDAVARFAVASTPRFMDRKTNEWKDGEPLFMECVAWRALAENLADSFGEGKGKGARVIVTGTLKQRSYEKEGVTRTVIELTADEVAASMRYATVAVTKVKRGGGGTRAEGDDVWAGAKKDKPSGGTTTQAKNGSQSSSTAGAAAPAATSNDDEFAL